MSGAGWWTTFFDGPTLELWRQATPPELTREEIERVLAVTGAAPGADVLDVPCGYGRHALEMASRGFRVVGIDGCAAFVDEARDSAATRGVAAEFRLGDLRELPSGGRFDLAVCLGNSFAYLDDDGNAAFLAALAGAVRPGGWFALNTAAVAECVLPGLVEREWRHVGSMRLLSESRHDPLCGVLEVDYILQTPDRESRRTAIYRVYTVRELAGLLAVAGFTVETLQGPDGGDFVSGDESLWLFARRGRA